MAVITGNGKIMAIKPENSQKGFTLIEMMIVISIIGILATIALPNFQKSIIRAKETSLRQSLFVMRDVIDQYYGDNGKYPESLEILVENKYMREIPRDPFTRSSDTWVLIDAEVENEEEAGVYDIKSGSDRVGLNGEPYNEW